MHCQQCGSYSHTKLQVSIEMSSAWEALTVRVITILGTVGAFCFQEKKNELEDRNVNYLAVLSVSSSPRRRGKVVNQLAPVGRIFRSELPRCSSGWLTLCTLLHHPCRCSSVSLFISSFIFFGFLRAWTSYLAIRGRKFPLCRALRLISLASMQKFAFWMV